MAPRLLGSFAAFAAFPVYLAFRGAPSVVEVMAVAWLIAPILLSYFLSRTGRYETAHVLSSAALVGLVMMLATATGGIQSFAAVWLIAVPLEAALSASRRVVGFASLLTLAAVATLIGMSHFQLLPTAYAGIASSHALVGFGIGSAALYAAGLALGAQSLTQTSASLLNVEEDRYRLLARHMSDVISRHRRDGAVEFISPAAEGLFGVATSELVAHGLFDRVHVADRPAYLTALSDVARGGQSRDVEFRIRRDIARAIGDDRLGGSEFIWIEMRCRPLETTPDGTTRPDADVVAVMRDVTDRKNQEYALEAARAAAERAGASKSRFLATMSHELRTPLNAIIGFSEMIVHEDTMQIDAARRKEYAQLINDSGLHLLAVVNGILDMSKMESGTFEIAPEPFAPQPALINCCNLLALKARDNGIDLVTVAPDDLPSIVADPRAFKQIVLNLVSNAIKFTERGGSVTVSARMERDKLMLRVRDTGVGIAADDLKRIGDPFFQAGKTYQRRYEGTGLGLSIVKSLVTLHGGEVSLDSKLDEGTTVTVALPLKPEPTPATDNIATLTPVPRQLKTTDRVRKSA
ncbi:MAG: PAS domain-containing sensor histidine kinase [Rhizobiales bacterium]|nr:PAS domain-containing sensor histidine kinase [Hyphomicrobiales bacterium]